MKVYGNPGSTCTRKVLTTLAEDQVPFEFVSIDFAKGEHKQPAHLAHQPFGQVPAIDDDGFELYESRAIARYIDQKAGGKLTPTDPKLQATMEQWISIETSNFTPHAMKFVFHHLMKRVQPQADLDQAAERLRLALGVMEQQLGKSTYLVGDQFTLADITFMPYFEYAMMTPAKEIFAEYPNVGAWWTRVSARPSWATATGR